MLAEDFEGLISVVVIVCCCSATIARLTKNESSCSAILSGKCAVSPCCLESVSFSKLKLSTVEIVVEFCMPFL